MKKSIENKCAKLGHSKVGKLLASDMKDLPKDKQPKQKSKGGK